MENHFGKLLKNQKKSKESTGRVFPPIELRSIEKLD